MKKYQIEDEIGSGNFSTVYKAVETSTKKECAVKVMKTHPNIALREAHLLKKLRHPNIASLLDFEQDGNESKLVLEKGGMNTLTLYQMHKYGLREEQVKCILFQSALALSYVHSHGIIHRDIKPQNILINRKTAGVKIIDFGLAIDQKSISTDYIATRWYRAPENLLTTKEYTCAIDVFSLGCVIVQLYLGNPLFPGDNNIDQILKIFNILGYPTKQSWPSGFLKMTEFGFSVSNKEPEIKLGEIISSCDEQLIKIILKMLEMNPKNRITCEQIIRNPYFNGIKKIVPLQVFQRFQKDHRHHCQVEKKEVSFRNTGKYKFNLNLKGNLSKKQLTKDATESFLHKSTEHYFPPNQKGLKKNTSIESIKSFHSQKNQNPKIIKAKKKDNDKNSSTQKSKDFKVYKSPKISLNSERKSLKEKSMEQKMSAAKESEDFLKYSVPLTGLEKKAFETSREKNIDLIIKNVPFVQTVQFCENMPFQQIKKQWKGSKSPSVIKSYDKQRHGSPNHEFLKKIKFSVKEDKSLLSKQFTPYNYKLNSKLRLDDSEKNSHGRKIDIDTNHKGLGLKKHVSPSHNFLNKNLSQKNLEFRTHNSPVLNHHHSPEIKHTVKMTTRKETVMSPPPIYSARAQNKSPQTVMINQNCGVFINNNKIGGPIMLQKSNSLSSSGDLHNFFRK